MRSSEEELETEFKQLAKQYNKQFGAPFPIYHLGGMSTEELVGLIEKALATGKPVCVEADPDVVY